MLVINEDVGNGRLAGHFGKSRLNRSAIIYQKCESVFCTISIGQAVHAENGSCVPTRSNSVTWNLAPISLNRVFVALQ